LRYINSIHLSANGELRQGGATRRANASAAQRIPVAAGPRALAPLCGGWSTRLERRSGRHAAYLTS